jgi:tetratricopeptide (TPR) repeat protein
MLIICLEVSAMQTPEMDKITFKTSFEEELLRNPDQAEDIHLLLAISEGMNLKKAEVRQNAIVNFRSLLEKKKFLTKSEEKGLKILFELIHERFFDKYTEVSNFAEIFSIREYNCVSATALYALILDYYKIPYQIKETPTHVYTVAYPNTKSIVLESTAPLSGYYSPGTKEIQQAVDGLVQSKFIKQSEVDAKGVLQVYNDFFYGQDNISIRQLAGLQYYNEMVQYYMEEQYEQALNSARKSAILYPSPKTEYLKFNIMMSILGESDFDNLEEVVLMTEIANMQDDVDGLVSETHKTILNNSLFLKGETAFVDSVYQIFSEQLESQTLKKTISEQYYLNYGQYYLQKSQTTKALEKLRKAYEINEKNVGTQAMITECLAQKFGRSGPSTGTISDMQEYETLFPFLSENSLYQSIIFYHYSYLSYLEFREDHREKGFEYLELMNTLKQKFKEDMRIDELRYGLVYAEAGAHYYRKKEYKKAKEVIEKGLELVPDHTELLARLEIVLDALK